MAEPNDLVTMLKKSPPIAKTDLTDLQRAKDILEYPSLTIRIADTIGKPIELGLEKLPVYWQKMIGEIVRTVLLKGLELAIYTLGDFPEKRTETWWTRLTADQKMRAWMHKTIAAITGASGGPFGAAALPIELPISTGIILRSIADIARSEGHDLSSLETRLSCLSVLALGSRDARGNPARHSNYWAVRTTLSKAVSEAAAFIAERGVADTGAPAIMRLILAIASRFSVRITEEMAAKAIPLISMATGATINLLFMDHFQDMARGHFIIKRLEKKYGAEKISAAYHQLPAPARAKTLSVPLLPAPRKIPPC